MKHTFYFSAKQLAIVGKVKREVLVGHHWRPFTEWFWQKEGLNFSSKFDDRIVVHETDGPIKLRFNGTEQIIPKEKASI